MLEVLAGCATEEGGDAAVLARGAHLEGVAELARHIEESDEVGRLATQARRSLGKLVEVAEGAQNRARQALIEGVALLRP